MPKDWGDAKRVEVVTTYLALGKAPMVEAVTGVPTSTIKQWKMQPWWGELVDEIQSENDLETDSKLRKIVDKSLEVVMDRLENGEFLLNAKTGKITRIPVKLRDVERVAVDLINKRDLIRDRRVAKIDKQETVDFLKKLAEQFALFARKEKTIQGEVIQDALHDQRQAGLQEGSQEVHVETVSDQKAIPAECGPQADGKESGTQNP